MPPERRRRKGKGDASDQSEAPTDAMMGPPPTPVLRVRHTESELSSSDGEDGKRFKPGTPHATRAASGAPVVVVDEGAVKAGGDAGAVGGAVPAISGVNGTGVGGKTVQSEPVSRRESRPRRRGVVADSSGADAVISEMKGVTGELVDAVYSEGVSSALARTVMANCGKYEALLMKVVAENERLRGRLEVYEAAGERAVPVGVREQLASLAPVGAVRSAVRTPAAVPAVPAVPVSKPVETWSVVVKGKGGVTSKEVVSKVVEQVGPTLGVRVHEVRPIRDGGAVIRTPSVAERQKIADNAKFAEVGLEVSVQDKLGPKVVVQRVHAEITPDEFMAELYEMNLKGSLSQEAYKRSVRLASSPWKAGSGGAQVNVILECTERVKDVLVASGVYIKWFRFHVRVQDAVQACYRCLGFDHRVRECRLSEDVCRRCGSVGHWATQCPNEMRCRNCAFKGLPADHMMMSSACPVFAARVARVNARH